MNINLSNRVSAERPHIIFCGIRNAGKSSVVNAVTGQKLSLVSDTKGTTTDPVQKAMEILPLGPVVIIDTPGIDDEGELGKMRVERALRAIDRADAAVLVADGQIGLQAQDNALIDEFKKRKIPYIIAFNKSDLYDVPADMHENVIYVSAEKGTNIEQLKEMLARIVKCDEEKTILGDLIDANDVVILVTPIDSSAPKGRLILPQQQTIRDILAKNAINVVVRETELKSALDKLGVKPKMVITDSQAFAKVSRDTPEDILLTSFSILFAWYKGSLAESVKGAAMLDRLHDGDTVLISEGCTHHRQCEDIGTVKLPKMITEYSGKNLNFEFTSGGEFPSDLSKYALVVHCGACMLNEREMHARVKYAKDCGVPITNYGIALAQLTGILRRALAPFPSVLAELDK